MIQNFITVTGKTVKVKVLHEGGRSGLGLNLVRTETKVEFYIDDHFSMAVPLAEILSHTGPYLPRGRVSHMIDGDTFAGIRAYVVKECR